MSGLHVGSLDKVIDRLSKAGDTAPPEIDLDKRIEAFLKGDDATSPPTTTAPLVPATQTVYRTRPDATDAADTAGVMEVDDGQGGQGRQAALEGRLGLVVALDSLLAARATATLDGSGLHPLIARDVDHALTLLVKRPVDLVLVAVGRGSASMAQAAEFGWVAPLRNLTSAGIVAITDKHDPETRALALMGGVDDCLGLELGIAELVARLSGIIAWTQPARFGRSASDTLHINGHQVILAERTVVGPDLSRANLTPGEARLMQTMLRANGQPVSREDLARVIAVRAGQNDLRAVDVLIYRLRRKINDRRPYQFIQSITGFGYRLLRPVERPRAGVAVAAYRT